MAFNNLTESEMRRKYFKAQRDREFYPMYTLNFAALQLDEEIDLLFESLNEIERLKADIKHLSEEELDKFTLEMCRNYVLAHRG